MTTMQGVVLPGNSTVDRVATPIPRPGHGQVLVQMKASGICGSDIRAIYREHRGSGAEAYQGVIAGHEPCGQVVALGRGCRRISMGDRVVIYHIAGCGQCVECRRGYMIGCQDESRAAYGWQRDGGHADYLLAEEATCILLPEPLSYLDGALVSCGFGTAYEALLRLAVSGQDRLLVTGLGPVGLAAGMLGRALGATTVIGVDISASRRELALRLGLVDHAVAADSGTDQVVVDLTAGRGCEVAVDCSGSPAGRLTALRGTGTWGRCAFVGEGNDVTFDVSNTLIHRQVTLYGSWVTSLHHMSELLSLLVRWGLHPEMIVTDRFPLERADEAYRAAAEGASGKVAIVFDR
ncbi:MAG: zinc-binding dehydrogenase [Actinomycetota bacterium]|nr:zinc-binding dehydrogenase [Actinomycetota bacterium]